MSAVSSGPPSELVTRSGFTLNVIVDADAITIQKMRRPPPLRGAAAPQPGFDAAFDADGAVLPAMGASV